MAGLIFKAPYYKPKHKTENGQSRGGLAKYIATRDGVEILRSGMAEYIGNAVALTGIFKNCVRVRTCQHLQPTATTCDDGF